ncbi:MULTISPECIES: hypothetical protein [Stenotrophomonas]|uniref:hypothetical protein n=1 Tax=Stenotrophomonas TaxID=40323 RepID=UPI001310490A|nr:hypothetical protein [Stenotrophomonas maltophilia]MBA0349468.1 hypothetical protein [Stenotrophomonas maltophilia]
MSSDNRAIAEALVQAAFGISSFAYHGANFSTKLVEAHFFHEMYEIHHEAGELDRHPEVKQYLEIYPLEFVAQKAIAAQRDYQYFMGRARFFELLKEQNPDDQLYIRRSAIYSIHCVLMTRDFGDFYDSLGSGCSGLTKEAEAFVESGA